MLGICRTCRLLCLCRLLSQVLLRLRPFGARTTAQRTQRLPECCTRLHQAGPVKPKRDSRSRTPVTDHRHLERLALCWSLPSIWRMTRVLPYSRTDKDTRCWSRFSHGWDAPMQVPSLLRESRSQNRPRQVPSLWEMMVEMKKPYCGPQSI